MKSLKRRFILVFTAFIILSFVILTAVASLGITRTGSSLATTLGEPVVRVANSMIETDKFEALTKSLDKNDPYYEEARVKLYNLNQQIQARYLFTMAKTSDGKYRYIIDGSCLPTDGDNFSQLGEIDTLEGWGKEVLDTFNDGKLRSTSIEYQEDWGWTVSSYIGIKNKAGKVIGIVGCDFACENLIKTIIMQSVIVAVIGAVLIIFGIFIILSISRRIFGTMKKVSVAMEGISSGSADLTARINVSGNDELTQLANNCNKVLDSMDNLVTRLKSETSVLSQTGNELYTEMTSHIKNITNSSAGVEDIGAGVTEQARRIEGINTGVQNVDVQIENLDQRIKEQAAAVQNSSSAIEQISANIMSVTESVKHIMSEYKSLVSESDEGRALQDKVSEQISQIALQSENLTEANQAIAAIAEQTNLLAMNAAIEAAHAGDLGKGFGVVADEIRALAETSATQSSAISELLGGISEAIANIVDSSTRSASAFESVGNKISTLNNQMLEVQNGMMEEEQGAGHILQTMKTLDGTTNAIQNASQTMKAQSKKVFDEITELKVLSEETNSKSNLVGEEMRQMQSQAENAVNSSELNKEAADNVVNLINGFKIS